MGKAPAKILAKGKAATRWDQRARFDPRSKADAGQDSRAKIEHEITIKVGNRSIAGKVWWGVAAVVLVVVGLLVVITVMIGLGIVPRWR